MDNYILHIDTATKVCSVALSKNGTLINERVELESNKHTSILNTFISESLELGNISINDLSAVSLVNGPGSYTGLRVGMAAAKGICYGLDIPLIGISTLESLSIPHLNNGKQIISCLDARRDEIYMAIFDAEGKRLSEDYSFVVPKLEMPKDWPDANSLIICGNAADKVKSLIEVDEVEYNNAESLAKTQITLAYQKYLSQSFDDIFLAKLNYLKPPNITKPRNKK